jgi:hypothetical protein
MKTTLTIAAALSTALLLGAAAQAQGNVEKCYGVAKAGKNDCQREDRRRQADGRQELTPIGRRIRHTSRRFPAPTLRVGSSGNAGRCRKRRPNHSTRRSP